MKSIDTLIKYNHIISFQIASSGILISSIYGRNIVITHENWDI